MTRGILEPVRCTAHSARTGASCKRWASHGATVCHTHGGAAPQVKKSAAERVAERIKILADPAVTVIQDLMKSDDERVRYAAAKDLLDRGGFKAPERQEISGRGGGPVQTEDVSLSDTERTNRIMAIVQRARERADRAVGSAESDMGPESGATDRSVAI